MRKKIFEKNTKKNFKKCSKIEKILKKKKLVKMFLKCAFRKEYMEYIFILVY